MGHDLPCWLASSVTRILCSVSTVSSLRSPKHVEIACFDRRRPQGWLRFFGCRGCKGFAIEDARSPSGRFAASARPRAAPAPEVRVPTWARRGAGLKPGSRIRGLRVASCDAQAEAALRVRLPRAASPLYEKTRRSRSRGFAPRAPRRRPWSREVALTSRLSPRAASRRALRPEAALTRPGPGPQAERVVLEAPEGTFAAEQGGARPPPGCRERRGGERRGAGREAEYPRGSSAPSAVGDGRPLPTPPVALPLASGPSGADWQTRRATGLPKAARVEAGAARALPWRPWHAWPCARPDSDPLLPQVPRSLVLGGGPPEPAVRARAPPAHTPAHARGRGGPRQGARSATPRPGARAGGSPGRGAWEGGRGLARYSVSRSIRQSVSQPLSHSAIQSLTHSHCLRRLVTSRHVCRIGQATVRRANSHTGSKTIKHAPRQASKLPSQKVR